MASGSMSGGSGKGSRTIRSSHLASNSVFHCRRKTCQVPSANAVIGMMMRMISPGPCRRPARMSWGGLSRIDWKEGSSAGWRCWDSRAWLVWEKGWRRGCDVVVVVLGGARDIIVRGLALLVRLWRTDEGLPKRMKAFILVNLGSKGSPNGLW